MNEEVLHNMISVLRLSVGNQMMLEHLEYSSGNREKTHYHRGVRQGLLMAISVLSDQLPRGNSVSEGERE